MISEGFLFFLLGVILSLIALGIAGLFEKRSKTVVTVMAIVVMAVIFVGFWGYCSGIGSPQSSLPPEGKPFVTKAVAEDEQNTFLLVVPLTDEEQRPIYYQIPREKILVNISAGDEIVIANIEGLVRKVT